MKKAELLRVYELLEQRVYKLEAVVAGIPAQPPYRPPQPRPMSAEPWPDTGTAPRYPWTPPYVVTCDSAGDHAPAY